MLISLEGQGPLYRQIYRGLRELILAGQVSAGSQLPVTRELAVELGVSRNVVMLAYDELIAEGYAAGRVGAGTYVSADIRLPERVRRPENGMALPPMSSVSHYSRRLVSQLSANGVPTPSALPYDFDHGAASPDDFPMALWRKLTARRLRAPSLDYMHPSGYPELREALTRHLKRSRGVECEPDQILIVNGSFQALDLTARVLLDPGDAVVIEDPHYRGARDLFLAGGAHLKATRVDENGIVTEELPRRSSRLKFAYVTPSHQFPSGAILPLQRRLALLAWAERAGAYLVEDDYDSEYRYGERPIEAMQGIDRGQRVIYIGTFSRILFPALRLGYVVLPKPLVPLFVQAKQLADCYSAPLPQQVLADFIQGGHFDHHIRKCRARKAALRSALLESLERHLGPMAEVRGASSGVHVTISLANFPPALLEHVQRTAAARGVGVYPARPYYLKPPPRSELIIGYGATTVDKIRTGVRILADVLADSLRN